VRDHLHDERPARIRPFQFIYWSRFFRQHQMYVGTDTEASFFSLSSLTGI
jgi:hypothetical protein